MKSLYSIYIIFFVLLMQRIVIAGAPTTYLFNFEYGSPGFVIECPASITDVAFKNSMSAIQVYSVECDGFQIRPEKQEIISKADRSEISVGAATVVYRFSPEKIVYWDDTTWSSPKEYGAIIYIYWIPKIQHEMIIQYRVRYPDGTRSDLHVVKYYASTRHFIEFESIRKKS